MATATHTATPTKSQADDIGLVGSDALAAAAAAPGTVAPPQPRQSTGILVSRILLGMTYVGGAALGIAVLYWLSTHGAGTDEFAWAISAIFVGLAVPMALHDIHMHMRHYMSPLQRHFIRLIAMVPIYALASWLALVYHTAAVYLESVRDLYEAFALWSFYNLMLEFLGGRAKLAARLRARAVDRCEGLGPEAADKANRAKCLPPVCCLKGWKMGSRFVHRNSVGLYQYVLIRLVVTVLILIFEGAHLYHEGDWSPRYFYLYAALTINASQIYALYCLAYLYSVVHEDLAPLGPLYKFLLVKGIVAVTWWQGIFINLARTSGLLAGDMFHHVPYEEQGKAMGNFMFCVEMLIAAVAYHFVYSYTDFFGGSKLAPVALLQRKEAELDRKLQEQAARQGTRARHGHGQSGVSEAGQAQGGARGGAGAVATNPTPAGASNSNIRQPSAAEDDEAVWPAIAAPASVTIELAPMPMRQAALDILPGDMIHETGDNLKSGFGLTHKWEKRAKARRAELHTWADSQLGSTVQEATGIDDEAAGAGAASGASTPRLAPPPGIRPLSHKPSFLSPSGSGGGAAAPATVPSSMRSKTRSRIAMSMDMETPAAPVHVPTPKTGHRKPSGGGAGAGQGGPS